MTANGTYSYEQPVTYWMPFNGGIGFHDADWQPYFGGDRYLTGGSHGCINLPPENAGQLYSLIQYDVPIIFFLLILYSKSIRQKLSCNAVGSCSSLPFVFCQTALVNVFPICRRGLCRVLKLGNVEEKI